MESVITWIGANWVTVVGTLGTVVMGASIIVKAIAPLTSTKIDDRAGKWLTTAHRWISKIALNPPKA